MYENPLEDPAATPKRLSNVINKRASPINGKCPFSGH
jgi:hypothetical protein